MKLRWTRLALTDFEQAHDHIAQDNPEVARQIAKRTQVNDIHRARRSWYEFKNRAK